MIENLQTHESKEVYEKAAALAETYFGTKDEAGDENIPPEVHGDSFAFGLKKGADEEMCPAGSGHAQPFTTYNFAS